MVSTDSTDSADSERPWIPLREVVARNAARLREELLWVTQREVAAEITRLGMPWSAARYGRLEAGEVTPTLAVLVIVAAAFDVMARSRVGRRVALTDLLRGAGDGELVELTGTCAVPADLLLAALAEPSAMEEVGRGLVVQPERGTHREQPAYGLTDWRVASALGISRAEMVELCDKTWGRTLTQERDARLLAHGVDPATASNTIKGRVAAELRAVLADKLSGG